MVTANANTVYGVLEIIQLVNFEYHLDFIVTAESCLVSSDIKYPGVHNSPNPNGIVQIIFHGDMPIARHLMYFAYRFVTNRPHKYM